MWYKYGYNGPTKERKVTSVTYENPTLTEDFRTLVVLEVTNTTEQLCAVDKLGHICGLVRSITTSKEQEMCFFKLEEVSSQKVKHYRRSSAPSLVIKFDGKLYYGVIPFGLDLMAAKLLGSPHQCSLPGKECTRLSAAQDADGSCAKVRNLATFIEDYPWIKRGYETFNTKQDCFVVSSCTHYKACQQKPRQKSCSISAEAIALERKARWHRWSNK